MSVTAKVIVQSAALSADGQSASIVIGADYAAGRNRDWAPWTPALTLQMTVKASLIEQFPLGQPFTLTFTPESV